MNNDKKFYINGSWVEPAGNALFAVHNPATRNHITDIALGNAQDVDRAVAAACAAFPLFSTTSRQERIELLTRILEVYLKRHDDVAQAVTSELGAPFKFSKELQAGTGLMHLQTAIAALQNYEFFHDESARSRILREPIGVVGMITPWNWPVNQIMAKVVPALAVGCTLVHKPSEIAPLSALVLAEIFHEAGVPAGVYNLVNGDGPTVGTAISSHPLIDMVSFTGSTAAGIDVAKRAADTVKRVHQELGGKSPNILLPGADLTKALTENIYRLMLNSGQSCHAPTRLLVPASLNDEVKAIAKAVVETVTVGDPMTDVYMGPLVSERQWQRVQGLIKTGLEEGATLLSGGEGYPAGLEHGHFVKPTIFADVTNQMTIAQEEIFGPVLSIITYQSLDDAVAIANDTAYGLAAFVQAATDEEAIEVAQRLQAGMVYINGASEDPQAPFGGYKRSGNGREWGAFAFDEYLETKAVICREITPAQ